MHTFTLQLATCVGIKYSYCKITSYYHIANVYQLVDMFTSQNNNKLYIIIIEILIICNDT